MLTQVRFRIDVNSHHFKLSRIHPQARPVLDSFAKSYVQYGLVKEGRRFIRAPVKVFAARTKDFSEYRFHINQYANFLEHIKRNGVMDHNYEVVVNTANFGVAIEIAVLSKWTPLEHQPPIIAYLGSDEPTKTKLVEIQTGKGKTFCAMSGAANFGQRFAICIRPMYIDKWVEDVAKVCGIKREEVLVIQGSTQLMQVIALGKSGELDKQGIKAIILSNKTLQLWYTLYESMGQDILEQGYDCLPDELFETLGVGLRIIDEVHQDFHLNFKIDLYTHVERSISLSATLKADDPFLNQMYEVAYPKPMRYSGLAYHRYIDSIAWLYRIEKPQLVRTTEWGSTKYSHNAFEKSIMKNPKLLTGYLEMVVAAANQYHFREYRPGDRLLVYFFSIEMCTIAADYLGSTYPHLDVRRYVQEDPYENVMTADVTNSTILSSGTGVDIPGLTTVIMTHSISSTQSNVQGFGRLREIPGRTCRFVYFTCTDLEKQVQYHVKKDELLSHMAKRKSEHHYPLLLGR